MDTPESTPELQTLDQVIAEVKAEAATEPDAEVEEPAAEPSPESEPEQEAPEEDSFSSIDPSKLPPELKKVYKSLQADYTRKTQSLSEQRKAIENKRAIIEAWEPAIELYLRDPQTKARVDKAFAQVEAAAEAAGVETKDEFEAFLAQYDESDHQTLKGLRGVLQKDFDRKLEELKAAYAQTEQRVSRVTQEQLERDAAAEARAFEKRFPTWQSDLTPKQQKLFYMELQEQPDRSPVEIYEELTAEFSIPAKKTESKTIDKLVGRANQRVLKSTSGSASPVESIDSMRDAFLAAKRELGMK